jgi:hypothetical protein
MNGTKNVILRFMANFGAIDTVQGQISTIDKFICDSVQNN